MSERLGARKFGTGDSEPFLGREMSHARDYSEEIASTIDDEVRRLIESAHDEAWDVLAQYRDVLDHLVLQLMEHETLTRVQVLEIFAPIQTRPARGSYTGYGKRMPSDRPPVLTPKELALTAASDGKELPVGGNGQGPGIAVGYAGSAPGPVTDPLGMNPLGSNPFRKNPNGNDTRPDSYGWNPIDGPLRPGSRDPGSPDDGPLGRPL
jgi:cell division protease FtsH